MRTRLYGIRAGSAGSETIYTTDKQLHNELYTRAHAVNSTHRPEELISNLQIANEAADQLSRLAEEIIENDQVPVQFATFVYSYS